MTTNINQIEFFQSEVMKALKPLSMEDEIYAADGTEPPIFSAHAADIYIQHGYTVEQAMPSIISIFAENGNSFYKASMHDDWARGARTFFDSGAKASDVSKVVTKLQGALNDANTKIAGLTAALKNLQAEFDAYKAAHPESTDTGGGQARTA